MITCPNCGKQLADGSSFCDGCGTQLHSYVYCPNCGQPTSTEFAFCQNCGASMTEDNTVKETKKKAPNVKKILGIGVAIIAVILVAAFLLPMILGAGKMPSYVAYVKDKELFYTPDGKKKAIQVTTDLSATYGNAQLAKDGKTMFYFDKMEDGGVLYARNIAKKNSEPIKIYDDVSRYSVADSGKLVTFLSEDGTLYQHDLKDRKSIKDDVSSYRVSDDGKKIYFIVAEDEDRDLYEWNGKESTKIASDVKSILGISEDFKTIYFSKPIEEEEYNYELYKKVGNKDAEKIASDVSDSYIYEKTGEIYYTVENEQDEDSKALRSTYTLYYYKNNSPKQIANDVVSEDTYAEEAAVMIYTSCKDVEVENYDDLEYDYYVVSKDKATAISIKGEEPYSFTINNNGSKMSYLADQDKFDEENPDKVRNSVLYTASISGGKAGTPEKYDSEVYFGGYFNDKDIAIYKEYDEEDETITLYVNKKKIDSDMLMSDMDIDFDAKKIVYYVDYDNEDNEGTLKTATFGGKVTKIADDVCDYTLLPNGKIVYLKDKSSSGKADLYITGNNKKVDEDVTDLIHVARD